MDFSKLSRSEWLGLAASALLVVAVLFLPWFDLADGPSRTPGGDGFLCGDGEFSCTGFETFPILRWLLLAAAAAPVDPRLDRRPRQQALVAPRAS